jgi:hypothetical protein
MYEKAALPSRSVESARKTASEEVRSYMEFIGLDVHRQYSVAARMEASGALVERRRLHNDELVGFMQSLAEPPKVAFEASGSWYHIYELLEPWVEELVLSHPLKTRIIAETKIKTDRWTPPCWQTCCASTTCRGPTSRRRPYASCLSCCDCACPWSGCARPPGTKSTPS